MLLRCLTLLLFAGLLVGCPQTEDNTSDVSSSDTGPASDTAGGTDSQGGADATAGGPDNPVAQAAVESSESSSAQSALVVATVQVSAEAVDSGAATTDEQAAEAAATSANSGTICPYGGTVSATTAGNVTTFVFDECSFHCGMHRATGTVVVTYTLSNPGVSANLQTTDFKVDQTTLTLDTSVVYTVANSTASLALTLDSTTTGAYGNTVGVSGSYDVSVDTAAGCITQDGRLTVAYSGIEYDMEFGQFQRCAQSCPNIGSRVAFLGRLGATLAEIEYTSGNAINWSTATGGSGTATLEFCNTP